MTNGDLSAGHHTRISTSSHYLFCLNNYIPAPLTFIYNSSWIVFQNLSSFFDEFYQWTNPFDSNLPNVFACILTQFNCQKLIGISNPITSGGTEHAISHHLNPITFTQYEQNSLAIKRTILGEVKHKKHKRLTFGVWDGFKKGSKVSFTSTLLHDCEWHLTKIIFHLLVRF